MGQRIGNRVDEVQETSSLEKAFASEQLEIQQQQEANGSSFSVDQFVVGGEAEALEIFIHDHSHLINIHSCCCETWLSLPTEENLSRCVGAGAGARASHVYVDVLPIGLHGVDQQRAQRWSQGSKNRVLGIPLFDLSCLQIKRAVR